MEVVNLNIKTETDMQAILSEVAAQSFRTLSIEDKIFKDECMYCFKTPLHPGGLFICMQKLAGLCADHIEKYVTESNLRLFLHSKETKKLKVLADEPQDKITKLAIGIEGGFSSQPKFDIISDFALVVHPHLDTRIAIGRLSGALRNACLKIIKGDGVQRSERLQAGVSAWDGEEKIITKHANLAQLENGVKLPASGWCCQEKNCGLTENLWLNLVDGTVKCGRSQFIQEGVMSKGNNHMREHFEKTGYPLVVKLGTVTKNGADVFSYDEDDSVCDPNLKMHLQHFDVDMEVLEKTEKSTLEMEMDMNQKWEWALCQEDGANLELAFGPGLTGIINLGSSCYINATIQMLLQIPEIAKVYGTECENIFSSVEILKSHEDFNCQTAKLFSSLLSGKFSKRDSDHNCVKPTQFKRVVGRGNTEFSSARQQDADEYIRYLIGKIDDNYVGSKPVDAVRFKIENRLEDKASQKVRYDHTEEVVLSLNVPLPDGIDNVKSVTKTDSPNVPMRPTVSFASCLSSTFSEQYIPDFRSPITGEVCGATQTYRFASFPDFLIIQLKKFAVTREWTIKKLDVNVDMPDDIDLDEFKAGGQQSGESLLPNNFSSIVSEKAIEINADVVAQLCSMGFTPEASRRAVYMTKNTGIQAASLWLMDHAGDEDVNVEHPDLVKKDNVDVSAISQLTALGFTPHQARYALSTSSSGINAAAEWLFANADSVPPEVEEKKSQVKSFRNGQPRYHLIGFISHMGTSPHSGHYVAHLKKDLKWYLFNDEKVAISQSPPKSLGYIYLYQRNDFLT